MKYDPKALRRIRAAKGLTLDELAASARLTKAGVSYIERGMVHPKASTLAKLATALGVGIAEFFADNHHRRGAA
jgi:transcriptional regulator with XRE-family HTH domain